MPTVPPHISAEDTPAPSGDKLERARELALQYFEACARVERLEEQLESAKEERLRLQMRDIPDMFSEIGVDRLGLEDQGVDVRVSPYYKANIAADWDDEKRERAFRWLEENGHGGVISSDLVFSFSRGDLDMMRELQNFVRTSFTRANELRSSEKMGVPWNILTGLVKTETEKGEVLPLETLGATVGRAAKIEKRKTKR